MTLSQSASLLGVTYLDDVAAAVRDLMAARDAIARKRAALWHAKRNPLPGRDREPTLDELTAAVEARLREEGLTVEQIRRDAGVSRASIRQATERPSPE